MAFVNCVMLKKMKSATLVEVIVALVIVSAGFALAISVLSSINMDNNVLRKISFIGKVNEVMLNATPFENTVNTNYREANRGELLKEITVSYVADSNAKTYLTKRKVVRR